MKQSLLLFLVVVAAAQAARAQQDDVRVRVVEGRLLISELNDSTQATEEARAFGGRLDDFFVGDDPGYNSFTGDLPPSAGVEWDFMPLTHGGVTSTLLSWDGVGSEPNFGPTDAVVTHFGQNFAAADADGGDEIVTGPTLFFADRQTMTSPGGGVHKHRDFFLHDGTFNEVAQPDEGFYLFSMRLRIDGFIRSDPFFVVLGTDGSNIATQTQVVVPWVEDNAEWLVLRGDHNFDGLVDAADYTVWRDGQGVTHEQADLADWQAGYGASAGSASAAASGASVPEPSGLAVLLTLWGMALNTAVCRPKMARRG